MTRDELRARVADLSVWKRGDERAPYKPLLLLWALGRLTRGEDRLAPYAVVDEELKPIFREFGPPRAMGRWDSRRSGRGRRPTRPHPSSWRGIGEVFRGG